MINVYPDEIETLYWVDVIWHGRDDYSTVKEPVPAQMLVFQIEALDVTRDQLQQMDWHPCPNREIRRRLTEYVENMVNVGRAMRDIKTILDEAGAPGNGFKEWIEAEAEGYTLEAALRTIAVADAEDAGKPTREVSQLAYAVWDGMALVKQAA